MIKKIISSNLVLICTLFLTSSVYASDFSDWKNNSVQTTTILSCLYEIESYMEKTVPKKHVMGVMKTLPVDIVRSGIDVLGSIEQRQFKIDTDGIRNLVNSKVNYAMERGTTWMHMLNCGIILSKAGLTK
jgi:hypothetical protein